MKKTAMTFALLVSMLGTGSVLVQAQSAGKMPAAAVRTLQTNAEEVRHNAAIFQWPRVNREVDRIVAAEKRIQQALAGDPSRAKDAEALRQAVAEMRNARLHRDSDRLMQSAQRLSEMVRGL